MGINIFIMKKIISYVILMLGLCISLNSCSSDIDEQQGKLTSEEKSNVQSRILQGCPEGQHAVLSYSFDEFHFHRPAKACESGFWFCTKGGTGWHTECVKNNMSLTASIAGRTAFVWARELDDKIEIHFPIALKTTEGYTEEDLSTFNVDEEYEIYTGITLKPGDYPVTETETELVVLVDLK